MRFRSQRKKIIAEINVVPYIDISLVLLLVFMMTAPLIEQGVEVDLPNAQANAVDTTQGLPLIVSVDAEGLYYLSNADDPSIPVNQATMVAKVIAARTLNPQQSVMMKADQAVPYGKVVIAMASLQQAGVEKVGLMTESTQ